MPPLVAVAAISAAGAVTGAGIQSHAAGSAADKQTQAANHAADVQGQSAHEALDFTKQQAERDQANFETTQKANYGQYAARQGRLSSLDQLVGLPARDIPAYVPTTQPASAITSPPPRPQPQPPVGGTTIGGMTQPTQTTQTGQMVTVRAPNGQTGQFPPAVAQHYVSLGAQVIH